MPVGAHAILGASSTHRWMNCPGSVQLSEGMPNKSSVYAAEGTAAHALAEVCLTTKTDPADVQGQFIDDEGDLFKPGDPACNLAASFEVNDEMVHGVRMFIDACQEAFDEAEMADLDPVMAIEKPFDLGFVRPNMFGTNDCCVFVPSFKLTVLDLKYGKGIVEATNNTQLKYYALGALRDLCWNAETEEYENLPDEVELVIVQPRAPHRDGPVRRWSTTSKELIEDYVDELRAAADATAESNADLNAGNWCVFCPAKAVCPALQGSVKATLGEDFEDMEGLDDDSLAEKGRDIANQQHASGDLAQMMRMKPLVEMWLKAIDAHAFEELKAGREVEGFKMVRKRSNRRWANKVDAADQLSQLFDEDQIYKPRELKSFTDVEKIDGAREVVAALVEKPEGTLTVAPQDDPRDAISVSAGSDFADMDD